MNPSRPCQRTRLASGPNVTIEACSCSMIHLNLGATTVRFTPEAFEGLASMVLEAVDEMATRTPTGERERTLTVRGMGRRVRGEA
jgi:hypothetical protein